MKVQLPHKLLEVFSGEARYRGAHGGRGSAKSQSFAKMLLVRGMERKRRLLCARELQNSIRESVHAELCGQIEALEMHNFYDYGVDYIVGKNGTEVIYRGLRHNYQSIKSLSNLDICWIEEAEYVSEESYKYLIPTVRNEGSEIWLTWNSERSDSPTHNRFITYHDPSAKIVELNWRDNPWFPDVLNQERLRDLERDPDSYQHIWEGKCITRSDAKIFNGKWEVQAFTPYGHWDGPYYGADWGFSTDPNTLLRIWIGEDVLYIEYAEFGYRVDLDEIPAMWDKVPGSRDHIIRADCARPETISHVKAKGFNVVACEKWPGSVEDGIAHLRGAYRKIVIHPRCERMIEEADRYSYKVDRLTNEITADIVDKFNHGWDACRYAMDKMITRKGQMRINKSLLGRR